MLAFTPYNGDPENVKALLVRMFHNGLMGFTTGSKPQRIRFLLPLGAVTKDIEEAIQIIDKSISEKNNTYTFRPIEPDDAQKVFNLSKKAQGGLSNLPKTLLDTKEIIKKSNLSFKRYPHQTT